MVGLNDQIGRRASYIVTDLLSQFKALKSQEKNVPNGLRIDGTAPARCPTDNVYVLDMSLPVSPAANLGT